MIDLNIILVCAGGVSTSILMKKMEIYAKEQGVKVNVTAKGICEYQDDIENSDLMLLGPQISYKREEIELLYKKPILVILPIDYATGNVKNIFKQINSVFSLKS
jgi:cellobiose PTS system EIIB component